MALRSPIMNVMVRAVEKAGRALVRDFGEVENLQVSRKGPSDFVSQADTKAEKTLVAELSRARPDFGFILEEGQNREPRDGSQSFILDPLDGTTNFLHGIPHFAISVAVQRDGEIVAGVVYNPVTTELYAAEKGQGAFLNDRRMRVSSRRSLSDAVVATGIPHQGRGTADIFQRELGAVMPHVAGVRRMGSAALDLAYVAAGRFDAFWERGLDVWDVAAGLILVSEAGGYVTEIEGGRNPIAERSLLAANTSLHLPLGKALRPPKDGSGGPASQKAAAG